MGANELTRLDCNQDQDESSLAKELLMRQLNECPRSISRERLCMLF